MNRSDRIDIFVTEIWQWYARHKRELPWRDLQIEDDAQRAYQILVSEIMLQQTQVERVKIVYKDFLNRFPKITDLADASNKEVIMAWRGMGYNSRALRLRDAARFIEDRGKITVDRDCFPRTIEELQKLPGVGHYTAAAIRNFAFNIPTACLDTNIRRILHRTFVGPENSDGSWKKGDEYLLQLAADILKIAIDGQWSLVIEHSNNKLPMIINTANWHAALMDFGSLVCTKRSPKWDMCPLTKAGIMKAAYKVPACQPANLPIAKREPGRMVGQKYIPNRIFRGKVVEELRDSKKGMTLEQIGRQICLDWDAVDHRQWLKGIIESLKKDRLIKASKDKLVLRS